MDDQRRSWLGRYLRRHTIGTLLLRLVCFVAALYVTIITGYATLYLIFIEKGLWERCYFAPTRLCGRYLGVDTDSFVLLQVAPFFILSLFSLIVTLRSRRADVVIGAPLLIFSLAVFVTEALSVPVEGG